MTTNLLDAYEQLIDFIAKHTLDRFYLINDQSVSLRAKISREIVGNILVHREYTSAYPAKIIIERGRIVAENWSLPKVQGRIDPNNFSPYPKNPLLAHFFINIGRADVLGSGVRNLYKYTKMYSGGKRELSDGDVFTIIVPLGDSNDRRNLSDKQLMSDKMSDKQPMSDKTSDKQSDKQLVSDKARYQKLFSYLTEYGEINTAEAAKILERSPGTARRILSQLVTEGAIVASGAKKPEYIAGNEKHRKRENASGGQIYSLLALPD